MDHPERLPTTPPNIAFMTKGEHSGKSSAAHKRAAVKYRQKQRRVEILIDPRSDESRALDRLVEAHGSVAAAVRFAILNA